MEETGCWAAALEFYSLASLPVPSLRPALSEIGEGEEPHRRGATMKLSATQAIGHNQPFFL